MGQELISKIGDQPDACWLFCSPENDLREFIDGIYDVIQTPHMIGCTTAGEISSEGFSIGSAVIAGVLTDQIEFQTGYAEHISEDNEKAGSDLARQFSSDVGYIQIFSDGVTGNGSALLRGIGYVLGDSLPISGGTAADSGKFQRTFQFIGKEILSDAIVGIGFRGKFRQGIGIHSGWSPIGLPKKVTRADGDVLYELNHEPALSVYKRFLGKHAEKLPEVGVEYPLILIDKDSETADFNLLRATMSVDRETGSIRFAGDIPQESMVCLTCGDKSTILEAAELAVRKAMDELEGAMPVMVFCYSCMARKVVLGRHTREELSRIRKEIGLNIPMIGFYSYGEYARIRKGGKTYLHNETIAVSIIGV